MQHNLKEYYNPVSGLELYPNINKGDRQCENGIMFLGLEIIMSQCPTGSIEYHERLAMFNEVTNNVEIEPGLYDRGSLDQGEQERTGIPKRTESHDNYSSRSGTSRYLGTKHAKDIADYGVRHGFSYNNRQTGIRAPFNPGNIPIWCALADSYLLLQIIFLPIYIINTLICLCKDKQETSGRLLTFIELYPLRKHPFWGKLYEFVMLSFKDTYGDRPLEKITEIYFRDENHPVRIAAKGFDYDK